MDKWFKLSPFHGDDTSSNLVWVTVCVADLAMLQIVVLAYVGSNPIVHLTGLTVITYGDISKGRKLYNLPLLMQSIQAIRHATFSKGKVSEAARK